MTVHFKVNACHHSWPSSRIYSGMEVLAGGWITKAMEKVS